MQPQPVNSLPYDLRYVYSSLEIEALTLMCAKYAAAEVEEGLENGISKVEIIQNVDLQVKRILRENLQKKEDCKEVTTFSCSLLDARTQMYQVDPINEVLNIHHELIFLRFILNELVSSDAKFTALINDDCFKRAREFSAQQMHVKFPLVVQIPAKTGEESNLEATPIVEAPEETIAQEAQKEPTE